MKRLLWIGDAACGSGFGRASHFVLDVLREKYQVSVLGVNYRGDPHSEPYPIYPAHTGGDGLGLRRLPELLPRIRPDVVVMQTNPWNVTRYMEALQPVVGKDVPVVGILAVEGKNCEGWRLNQLAQAIFWVEFGRQEAIEGGMTVPSSVVPLGVDLNIYAPGDRQVARQNLELPERCMDAFILGNINRNQHRKRLDLTIQFFAKWIRSRGIEDAYLYLHVLPGSAQQVDCDALAAYYGRDEAHPKGVQDRLILAEPSDIWNGVPERTLVETYRCFDAQINTALGEGWGLTMMEGMACGVPQIGGDFAAFGEWARGAALLVPCPQEGLMPDVHVMIGATMNERAAIAAMDALYQSEDLRQDMRQRGLDLVYQPQYRWEHIGRAFAAEIEQVCG